MELLCSLFLLFVALSLGNGAKFYVHPNNSSRCPRDTHCNGINEYAGIMNDSIYYFLPGVHKLNRSINIEWGSNLTFQGEGMMKEGPHTAVKESPVVIQCVSNATITFGNCNDITLSNLTIKNCGNSLYRNPGLVINASSAVLSYMSLQEIQWAALLLIDVSDIMVNHSSFYKNDYSIEVFYNNDSLSNSSLKVNECNFTESYVGLFLALDQNVYIDLRITDVQLYDNSYGIYLLSTASLYDIQVDKLVSIGCSVAFSLKHNSTSVMYSPSISITDSLFSQSSWRALILFWYGSADGKFHLNSTILDNNLGSFGIALLIATDEKKLLILLHNLTFDNNGVMPNTGIKQSLAVTLGLLNSGNINISNCTFSNNRGSALGLVNTLVTFFGNNYFINNAGHKGGGINFIITSYIYLSPDAYLLFIDNHAKVTGGAINIDQPAVYFTHGFSAALCFFQLLGTKNKTYFYFDNNTADVAGTAVYGGAVDSCLLAKGLYFGRSLFLDVSTFVNQPGYSVISSDPLNVCFCNDDNSPNCSLRTMDISAFPGQIINFTIAVVGELGNLTTGTIDISNNNSVNSYDIPTANCTEISYKFKLKDISQTNVILSVTIQNSISFDISAREIINVKVLSCSNGFCLSINSLLCNCEYIKEPVSKSIQSCTPSNYSVTKQPESNLWLSGTSECTILYSSCPFDYCIGPRTFNLSRPDEQCASNRAGDLCGTCSGSFSLMLGSNRCGECSNAYLALIIPFAIFGIVLVILIVALNLTVTVGTINGLLFFANIIKIYQPLIPRFNEFIVLSQFISWINMDFGIETCFYNGMESCGKTGLQFVFTVYLWALILLIIFLSQQSMKLARLMDKNAVPVLCTLLLLSYTKLLRTIFSILTFDRIYQMNNTDTDILKYVWSVDGTIEYARGCHLVLFIIALLVLTFLVLPYTMLLLLFPLWELCRSKSTIGTTYYIKLKPFFDAYAGPYTDSFRFWPGMLLVARILLAAVVATKAQNEEDTGVAPLGLLVAVVVLLLTALRLKVVYKSPKLNVLDEFHLFCLVIVAISIYVAKNIGETITEKVTLAFSFVCFLGIIAYHTYNKETVKKTLKKVKKATEKVSKKSIAENSNKIDDEMSTDEARVRLPTTTSVLDTSIVFELREPLLDIQES